MASILRDFLTLLLLLAALGPSGSAATDERVYFSPPIAAVAAGDTLSVYVSIDSGISLVHYYRVRLQYDRSILHLDTIVPSRAWDSIALKYSGHSFFYKDSLDPISGEQYHDLFSAFYTQPPHIDGPNQLARIRFTALQSGISPVEFYSYRLENNVGLGQLIPCGATDGLVYVCPLPEGFMPGNMDGKPGINVADLTYLVSYLFRGGTAPIPLYLNADVNCDLSVNVADLTYLVSYLFRDGLPPCDPCNQGE